MKKKSDYWIIGLSNCWIKRIKSICNLQFFFILFLSFFLAGCGALIKQPPAIIKYYQINYPAPPPAKEKIDKTIMVRPFNISSTYNRDSLVYTDDSYKCGFYQYDQWIAPPAGLIYEKIVRDLQATDCFEAVLTFGSFQTPDIRITASIDEIGEERKLDSANASVIIHFSVTKTSVTNIASEFIIGKTYSSSFPCEKGNIESLVSAISKAVQAISKEFISDLQKAILLTVQEGREFNQHGRQEFFRS